MLNRKDFPDEITCSECGETICGEEDANGVVYQCTAHDCGATYTGEELFPKDVPPDFTPTSGPPRLYRRVSGGMLHLSEARAYAGDTEYIRQDLVRETPEVVALRNKIKVYESFLHRLQLHAEVTMDVDKVRDMIARACSWSYAHRAGNGELSHEEQEEMISRAFERLKE